MTKKVLMICQNYYPEIGSAANRMKNIHTQLKQKGYDVTVLTSDPSYPNRNLYKKKEFWDEHVAEEHVIRVKTKTRKYTRNMLNRLFLYIEVTFKFVLSILRMKKEYDFIFVSSPPIFLGIAGVIAKKKLKAPLILDIRDLWPDSLLGVGVFTNKYIIKFAHLLEKYLYKQADKTIINSEYFEEHMTNKGVREENISFMPNSLTEEEMMYHETHRQNEINDVSVVYTGNIGLAQDIVKLLTIAERLKDTPNLTFKIIGYGIQMKEVERLINEKGLTNIKLYPAMSRKETLQEITSADIAYVSLIEQDVFKTVLPGKLIDYMGMKTPIVGDVSGYAAHIIKEANCGLVATEKSVEQLCENIVALANEPQLRTELGKNGYEYATKKWRWNTNINVLTTVMEGLDDEKSVHVCVESLHQ
jgi:glycosyltransferase involved in cell wall biosynthesis